jgi:hypothetical protein
MLYLFHTDGQNHPRSVAVAWSSAELAALENCRQQLRGVVMPFVPLFPRELIEKILPQSVRNTFAEGQRLLVSLHGRLHGLPLHVLDFGQKDFLIRHWPVQYIPTLALLPLHRSSPRADAVLLGIAGKCLSTGKAEGSSGRNRHPASPVVE